MKPNNIRNARVLLSRVTLAILATALVANVRADYAVGGVGVNIKPATGNSAAQRVETDAGGIFRFSKLSPGNYVLTLDGASLRKRGAQTENVKADVLAAKPLRQLHADRLIRGIPVVVAANGSIAGQVYANNVPDAALKAQRLEKVRGNVKVMNGKRYVWIPTPLWRGSNIPGKWVEEGSEDVVLSPTATGYKERDWFTALVEASSDL